MAYIKKLVKSQALRTFQTILNAAQNTFCSASRTIDGCRPPGKYCRYHTKGTGSRAIVVFGTSNMIRSSSTALHVQGFEYQQDSKTIFWWVLISLSKEIMSQDCKGQCFLKQQSKDISCLDSWSFGYLTSQHKQIQVSLWAIGFCTLQRPVHIGLSLQALEDAPALDKPISSYARINFLLTTMEIIFFKLIIWYHI